jgi:hypothetical protein
MAEGWQRMADRQERTAGEIRLDTAFVRRASEEDGPSRNYWLFALASYIP